MKRMLNEFMQRACVVALGIALLAACFAKDKMRENMESSRDDAERGVLSASLNSEQRARIELLGRTSAPTRYTERTDANRVRVVALNFGGVALGQCADASGNLMEGLCNKRTKTVQNPEQLGSLRHGLSADDEQKARDLEDSIVVLTNALYYEDDARLRELIQRTLDKRQRELADLREETRPQRAPRLHSGMFRQFSTQVGMTIETDAAFGPAGNVTRYYHSRNFLIIEWRRYYEERLALPTELFMGIRARLVDVRNSLYLSRDDLSKAAPHSLDEIIADFDLIIGDLDSESNRATMEKHDARIRSLPDRIFAAMDAIPSSVPNRSYVAAQLRNDAEYLRTIIQEYQPTDASASEPNRPYVSAIEKGIAVRIIFDVQLRTTDSQLSASFGIANLAAVLARNEATVEVSYEVTGTTIDPLPEEAIIISSVDEYLDAFKRFHIAVADISNAWDSYAIDGSNRTFTLRATDQPSTPITVTDSHFGLAQLAYYVQGTGVGDIFALTKNAEMCQDMQEVRNFLVQELEAKAAELQAIDCGNRQKAPVGRTKRERDLLEREYDNLVTRHDDIKIRMAESTCRRACSAELRRLEVSCAADTANLACPVERNLCLHQCAGKVGESIPTKLCATKKRAARQHD